MLIFSKHIIKLKAKKYKLDIINNKPSKSIATYKKPANRGPINRVELLDKVSIANEVLKSFSVMFSVIILRLTAKSITHVVPFIKANKRAKNKLK